MAEKNKNPEVRFAGFTDDWEQHELGEVLTERKILQKISDDAPILAFASGQGVIDRSERKSNNRDHLTLDQTNKIYKLTEYDDIVYNPSNLKYGAIDRNKHGRGVISPIYVTFTTKEKPSFIELIVKSEKFKLRALQYEEGTVVKRQSVKPENLLSLDVKISPSRDEQKKIGVLFERFDNLLTLHQSKYDKLINVKKAMLEKMFPKNSANVPEIRFKGFAENWGQSELGQIVKITMGQSPNGENYTDNPEDYILVQGNADMKNEMVVPRVWTKQVTKTADAEDLIMSVRAPVGEVGKTLYDVVIGRGVAAIKGNEFIFQSLKRMNERGYWKRFSAGSTFDSINSNELSKAVILTTKDYEQSKIGSFFKHLDNLISLHLQELEKLKNIKKACLEKMFV